MVLLIGIPSAVFQRRCLTGQRMDGVQFSLCVYVCECLISSLVLQEVPWSASSGDLCWRSGTWILFSSLLPLSLVFSLPSFPFWVSPCPPSISPSPILFPVICTFFQPVSKPVLHFFSFLLYLVFLLSCINLLLSSCLRHCISHCSRLLFPPTLSPHFSRLLSARCFEKCVMVPDLCQYGAAWPNGWG